MPRRGKGRRRRVITRVLALEVRIGSGLLRLAGDGVDAAIARGAGAAHGCLDRTCGGGPAARGRDEKPL